jgi:nicotinamide-nucleotide amidase
MSASTLVDADGSIAALAQRVVSENQALGRTVAAAESCTGGMVATAITDISGSSAVFLASLVTYSNAMKQQMLCVSGDILETFGAVSEACAWAMAKGALKTTGADVAVAISGIAGPGGGSDTKPVGTVAFARAMRDQPEEAHLTMVHQFDPALGRDGIRRAATKVALELLLPVAASDQP